MEIKIKLKYKILFIVLCNTCIRRSSMELELGMVKKETIIVHVYITDTTTQHEHYVVEQTAKQ